MSILGGAAAVAVIGYIGLCGLLFVSQRSMLYFPQPRQFDSEVISLSVEEEVLLASVRPLTGPKALIYFGGNAEDVSANLASFSTAFPDRALYLLHYRGYGGSSGTPSEEALHADALTLYQRVLREHANIVVVGRSLGSGVAVRLASLRPVERLVLISPYDSLAEVAGFHYPYVPVDLLLHDKFESFRHAPNIKAPTTILVAEHDDVIPHEHSEKLYALFPPGVATYKTLPGTDHNSISGSPEYLPLIAGR